MKLNNIQNASPYSVKTSQALAPTSLLHAASLCDSYGQRIKSVVMPLAKIGCIAVIASLHLPLTAARATASFEDADADTENMLAQACIKGVTFLLAIPAGALLAIGCVIATCAVQLVYVPYAMVKLLPNPQLASDLSASEAAAREPLLNLPAPFST